MKVDEWKPIDGYNSSYFVNCEGQIKRVFKHNKFNILRGGINSAGYQGVILCKNGVGEWKAIHRLVAEAFIPNPDNLPCINHKDGNKLNNCVENLEWCTQSHNVKHAYNTGLHGTLNKTLNPNHKLTIEQVQYIKTVYVAYDHNFGSSALARKFNVCQSTISRIVRGENWA